MPFAAAAAVAGAVITSRASKKASQTQADAARDASDTQLQAARESNDLQKQIYDQNRADSEPWRTAGVNALGKLDSYSAPAQALPTSGPFGNANIGNSRQDYADARFSGEKNVPNVGAWYSKVLGRPADEAGEGYWESEIRSGKNPDEVYKAFINAAEAGGASVNPEYKSWQQTADSNYANARFSDPDSAYANTDIGSAPSEYRNPDLTTQFGNADFKDADSAYANPKLQNLLADFSAKDFQEDPGYQYRLEQGNRGVENSAAAKGSQLSGATLKALGRFNQNEASNEYDKSFNRFRTQKLDQYGQSVDDFGRTEGQRQEKYAQRGTQYGLDESQRQSKLGLDTSNYGRADAQRVDQYGQRVDKFGRDETQRLNKYSQRVDEFGRLEGQRKDQYGQQVDQFGRLENQRQDQYGQATDLYNRNENQRINQYGINTDQYNRGTANELRDYNRLAERAGIGQRVNESNAEGATNYANQVNANTTNAASMAGKYGIAVGDAQASGTIGGANALGRGLNSAYGAYQNYQDTQKKSGYDDEMARIRGQL